MSLKVQRKAKRDETDIVAPKSNSQFPWISATSLLGPNLVSLAWCGPWYARQFCTVAIFLWTNERAKTFWITRDRHHFVPQVIRKVMIPNSSRLWNSWKFWWNRWRHWKMTKIFSSLRFCVHLMQVSCTPLSATGPGTVTDGSTSSTIKTLRAAASSISSAAPAPSSLAYSSEKDAAGTAPLTY